MGRLYRYQFTKKIYPNYIVFLLVKGKYRTYDMDLKIVNYLNFDNKLELLVKKHINYLILDDLEIIDMKEFEDNNYEKYILLFVFDKVMNQFRKKLFQYY